MRSPLSQRLFAAKRIETNFRGASALLFASLMVANVIGYGYQMLMARMMTPGEYGALVTLTSISYVLAVLMRTFQAWVIEAVASARNRRVNNLSTVFMVATRTLVPLGVAAFAVHWLASGLGADFFHLNSSTPFLILGLYTFSSFLVLIPRGILLGVKRARFASFTLVVEPLVRVSTAVVLVTWGFGINGATMGFVLGNLVTFVIALIPLWPLLAGGHGSDEREQDQNQTRLRMLDGYTLSILAVNACLMLLGSVDQIAVKHYFSDQVAGNYAVAFLLGRVIAMTTIALSWVLFTRSATMMPDDPRRAGLLRRALVIIGTTSISLTAAYMLAPGTAVRLMGGSEYGGAAAYVGPVGVEMTLFALVYTQAYFQISLKQMQVTWGLITAVVLETLLVFRFHDTVIQMLLSLIFVLAVLLIYVSSLSWWLLNSKYRKAARLPRAVPMTVREVDLGEASHEGVG